LAGIGAEAARVILKHKPGLLILASRNKSSIEDTIAAIGGLEGAVDVRAVELDLADLDSVRAAAAEVLEHAATVDVLINNAAVMGTFLPKFETSKQGYEMQFAVNHLGHFLFTNLLMPALLRSAAGPRVVNISSAGHRAGPVHLGDVNFDNGKAYEPFVAYGQSKTANMLFTVSLAQKLSNKGLRSYSVDPGSVGTTGLARHMPLEYRVEKGWWNADGSLNDSIPWHSVGIGASSYIVAAFDQHIDGKYWNGKCLVKANVDLTVEPYATDPDTAEKLWLLSEKLVEQDFRYV
ncbi:NAD(P)-binding protein, partial [Polyplosphaeria fusca]